MSERLDFRSFVAILLDGVPDHERDVAVIELLGVVAAELTMLVGGRAAAAAIYPIADLAATQHIPAEDAR